MRQDPRELSNQELYDKLREARVDLFIISHSIRTELKKILVPESPNTTASPSKRYVDGLINSRKSIQVARNYLREVLEIVDTSGCLPEPEIDIPSNPSSLPSGLEGLAKALEEVEGLLKELTKTISEYYLEGWAVRYHEQAVMEVTQTKQQLFLCSNIKDEKSTAREKERTKSSTDSLHSTDRGFQASGRAGQYSE